MTSKALSINKNIPSIQDDLSAYLSRVNQIPVLTREEEQKLTHELFDNNNLEAARQLIMHHLRFVVYIAKNYRGYGLSLSDLVQEGNVGLMKAVKSFDPGKNVRLASFAVHWIKSEINEFIIKNWKMVKIATTKEQRKLFFNLRSKKKGFNWLSQDEAEIIANDLNVSKKQVFEMESRISGQDVSFDMTNQDEENDTSPSSWLTAEESADPALIVEHDEMEKNNKEAIQKSLMLLDSRSREIIMKRWLDEGNKLTLNDLAEEYGVSAERIRQIENNAMKKLRHSMII